MAMRDMLMSQTFRNSDLDVSGLDNPQKYKDSYIFASPNIVDESERKA